MVLNNTNNNHNQRRKNLNNNAKHVTARLLVLGDRQVGKSASIVKYTTGRFIQDYSDSTNDWLYTHSLGIDHEKNSTNESLSSSSGDTTATATSTSLTVELLEQKDIQNLNSNNFFATSSNLLEQQQQLAANNLASRVALDQQMDNELHDKQNMLNKLHWADAYIVIYAINDINTFNKAIKYLNVIANNINSPLDNQSYISSSSNSSSTSNSSASNNNSNGNSPNSNCNSNNKLFSNNNNGNNFTYASMNTGSSGFNASQKSSYSSCSNNSIGSVNNSCINCSNNNNSLQHRRPILLIGNKSDLEKGARQVSSRDGRLLAMRHLSMFAELSIPNTSQKSLENMFSNLIDNIYSNCHHFEHQQLMSSSDFSYQTPTKVIRTQLTKWKPSLTDLAYNSNLIYTTTAPVWGNIVKSQPIIGTSCSSRVKINSNKIGIRQDISDIRLVSPLVSVAQSMELTNSVLKKGPMRAYGMGTNSSTTTNNSVSNNNRYENLKTSFKRASMAIVGVRGLRNACNHHNATKGNGKMFKAMTDDETNQSTTNNKSISEQQRNSLDLCDVLSAQANNNAPKDIINTSANVAQQQQSNQNWLKNHMRLYRVGNSNSNNNSQESNLNKLKKSDSTSLSGENYKSSKRHLFKYKTRRTSVALEEIASNFNKRIPSASLSSSLTTPTVKPTLSTTSVVIDSSTTTGNPSKSNLLIDQSANSNRVSSETGSRLNSTSSFASARSSSGRSSSSLSTSDTYYNSLLASLNNNNSSNSPTNDKAQSSIGSPTAYSSNYCSKGSTSAGSYDISDDEEFNSTTTIKPKQMTTDNIDPKLASNKDKTKSDYILTKNIADSNRLNNHNNIKRRYQLVKSVQSTLSNLTKSSNISTQAAKRSFCNTLFKYSSAPAPAVVAVKAVTPLVATTEQIVIKPVVEYCK